ncbi:hypothetical protein ABDD95_13845 [Mucilaginibacter sp. PAMB04274]|uniref:hypothetical protein n=1 Tax=Mucilaginibacter sp. PAMB04274 TaxID=3138568 RepID=UPI0031F62DEF
MKKLVLLYIYLGMFGAAAFATPLDSLKQQLQLATDDTQKASIYTQMANCYLQAKSPANAYSKRINQENAINYTMLAMKVYYKHDDTTGLVTSYSNLSKAYRNQRKFAQAKWFILQANTLSRKQNSAPAIVSSLVDLAAIKIDIKDYNLAKRDLREAHKLALRNKLTAQDSSVKESYSRLYTYIRVPASENVFQGLDATIKKEEIVWAENQKKLAIAALKAKKLQSKKKVYAVVSKKRSGDVIKSAVPSIAWETPSSTLSNDTVKTVSL